MGVFSPMEFPPQISEEQRSTIWQPSAFNLTAKVFCSWDLNSEPCLSFLQTSPFLMGIPKNLPVAPTLSWCHASILSCRDQLRWQHLPRPSIGALP